MLRATSRKNPRKDNIASGSCDFLKDILENAPVGTTGLLFHYNTEPHEVEGLGIDSLLQEFFKTHTGEADCHQFFQFCREKMTDELCTLITKDTVSQATSPLWHALRFARVTASKAYDVAHSSGNIDSSLVMSVIGSSKLNDTDALKRGRELEPLVLKELKTQIGNIFRTGIFLTPRHPVLGASPDGITKDDECIVEVKCPTTTKKIL